jgi:hypothetical protein
MHPTRRKSPRRMGHPSVCGRVAHIWSVTLMACELLPEKLTGGAPLLVLFEKWAYQLPTSKDFAAPRLLGRDPVTSSNHTPKRTAVQHTLHSSVRH